MILIGGFYRHVKMPALLVKVHAVVNDSVIVSHVGELERIGRVPYPYNYFVNAYELDG